VVLDSNVVLGLFWFQDPHLSRLAMALETGQLHWCITAQMCDELLHVMTRGDLAPSMDGAVAQDAAIRAERVMAEVERLSQLVPPATSLATPRCTDPQDQMFIPDGHFKFLHPWPGQIPPGQDSEECLSVG